MTTICLSTAISITGLSKRTLWRRIGEGRVAIRDAQVPGEETRLALNDVLRLSNLKFDPDEHLLIVAADRGDREAQRDLGLLLLNANRPRDAIHWLALAAKQYDPNAMCYLGRCYLACEGIPPDRNAGMMWIGQAAAKGHRVARALLLFLQTRAGQQWLDAPAPAGLEAALDAVERKVMLEVLAETADPQPIPDVNTLN